MGKPSALDLVKGYVGELPDLAKATPGEGSRGGKVVGHSASGKPIYAGASHAEMAQHHQGLADAHSGAAEDAIETNRPLRADHHDFVADDHRRAATEHRAAAASGKPDSGAWDQSRAAFAGTRNAARSSRIAQPTGVRVEKSDTSPLDLVKAASHSLDADVRVGSVLYHQAPHVEPAPMGDHARRGIDPLRVPAHLVKAGPPPPAGFTTVPGGFHGGYRKMVAGGKYEYWYPSKEHAQRAVEAHKTEAAAAHDAGEQHEETAMDVQSGGDKQGSKIHWANAHKEEKRSAAHTDHAKGAREFVAKQDGPSDYAQRKREFSEGGGKVIGHTSSGKPVYAAAHQDVAAFKQAHHGWSAQDHEDAQAAHNSQSSDLADRGGSGRAARFHGAMAAVHHTAAAEIKVRKLGGELSSEGKKKLASSVIEARQHAGAEPKA